MLHKCIQNTNSTIHSKKKSKWKRKPIYCRLQYITGKLTKLTLSTTQTLNQRFWALSYC